MPSELKSAAHAYPVPRIGLVGAGAIGERHLLAGASLEHNPFVFVVDRNEDRAHSQAAQYPSVTRVATDHRALVGHVDGAVVAVPNDLHSSVAIDLLDAGVHVLVEKPAALSVDECLAMEAAARRTNTTLAVGHMRRFLACTVLAHELIASQKLGRVHRVDVREGNIFNWPGRSNYVFDIGVAGGGALMDLGPHVLDLLIWWFGPTVEQLEYRDDSFGGMEAECLLELRFEGGVRATVELSRTRDLRNTAIIEGQDAMLEIGLRTNHARLEWERRWAVDGMAVIGEGPQPSPEQQSLQDLLHLQLDNWLGGFQGEPTRVATGQDGRNVIGLIQRCYSNRRPLQLPWVADEGVLTSWSQ